MTALGEVTEWRRRRPRPRQGGLGRRVLAMEDEREGGPFFILDPNLEFLPVLDPRLCPF